MKRAGTKRPADNMPEGRIGLKGPPGGITSEEKDE